MNKNIARIIIAALILLGTVILANDVNASLSCNVTDSCDFTTVFHMSNVTDAHAELRNNSDYSYKVCCWDTANRTIETGCSPSSTTLLHLSNQSDAHAELANESDYSFNVCLNTTVGNITYSYATSCAGYDTCLATLSTDITGKSSDLHVADCTTDPYSTKICVSLAGKGVISTNTSATPFYTTSANPQTPDNASCLADMKRGNKCNVTWAVVATGPIHSIWEFFATFTPINYSAKLSAQQSAKVNITIAGDVTPTITTPIISPSPAYTNDTLDCSWTATDPDTSNLTANVTWYKNGTINRTESVSCTAGIVCNTTNDITANLTLKGEAWNCTLFAYDANSSSANKSVALTIQNALPIASNITLNSTDNLNRTNGSLQGFWAYSDIDSDAQQRNETLWYNNSIEVAALRNLTAISASNLSKGQNWVFSVRVYDGENWSSWFNSTALVVNNTAPTHTIPILNSSTGGNYTNESLTCYNQSINDIDNDAVTLYYRWYNNNTVISSATTNILGYNNFSKNDNITCEITPSDGAANGTIRNSTKLTILNYQPVFNKTIENITWSEDITLTNNISLYNHFYDIDNDNLSYNITGNSSVRVIINSTTKNVTLTPNSNWYGTETIYFTAADGQYTADSNSMILTVSNVNDCGDSVCESGEETSCAADCDWCGDNECSAGETCSSCSNDCGSCEGLPPPAPPPPPPPPPPEAPVVESPIAPTVTPVTFSTTISASTRTSLACTNITYTEGKSNITLSQTNISKLAIPEGYDTVLEPFNLECSGESLDITLSIPENYANITLLKCLGNICSPTEVTEVTELRCGKKIKEITRETKYLGLGEMPIEIKEKEQAISDVKKALKTGNNSIQFIGKIFENLTASVSMPKEAIEEAENPSLKIIGTPLVLTISHPSRGLGTVITMPYKEEKTFEEGSIALYAKTREGWDYLGGEIDKENKLITANITDIASYLDNESKAVFALMGVLCTFCTNSSLELIFEPEPKSRNAILMVHGFASSPATYQEIIDDIRLTSQPFSVFTFGYPSSKSLDEVADEFSTLIEAKADEFDNIYIVAHSTGGLITQQALYSAYNKNYSYAQKTRKVILVGVPNEGAPVFEVYQDLFKKLVNQKTEFSLFNLNSKNIDELAKGKVIPRVPGIKYYVIAGTRQYALNLLFYKATSEKVLGTYNISDGIVNLESAQNIGGSFVNDKCDNYWEVNLTHMNLIDDPVARKIIEKVIAEEILGKELTLMGYNKYFDLKITECSKNEKYVVIGKKIAEEKTYDPTGCKCGNGICGEGEDALNCPSDCAVYLEKKPVSKIPFVLLFFLVIAASFIYYRFGRYKLYNYRIINFYKLSNLVLKLIKDNKAEKAAKLYSVLRSLYLNLIKANISDEDKDKLYAQIRSVYTLYRDFIIRSKLDEFNILFNYTKDCIDKQEYGKAVDSYNKLNLLYIEIIRLKPSEHLKNLAYARIRHAYKLLEKVMRMENELDKKLGGGEN